MTVLEYRLTYDVLFKMLFVEHPEKLKKLVAMLLEIPLSAIRDFSIVNPEIPPDTIGKKFCRLDINMLVNGQRVNIEVQVANEGDFPERSLFYWSRGYSSALVEGENYIDLPRVFVISILAFNLFECDEYYSSYSVREDSRHELLTNKLNLRYFELPKLSENVEGMTERELWLALFNAKTEEDLARIEALEVPDMSEVITAYRTMTATEKFREADRLRRQALSNEAAALHHAREVATAEANRKWQGVVANLNAEKDAAIDAALAENARLRAMLAERQ